MEKRIKNIMEYHLHWGTSKQNAITEIKYEIATAEELELLEVTWNIPELEKRAEDIYKKYKAEYYNNLGGK